MEKRDCRASLEGRRGLTPKASNQERGEEILSVESGAGGQDKNNLK